MIDQILPRGWEITTIGTVCDVVGGGTPKTSVADNFEGGEIPWITPADLSGYKDKYITRGSRNITEKGLSSSSTRLLPANTVLFSSRAPIGYVAIALQPVATNQGFKSFVLPEDIDPSFVYFYLLCAKETINGLGGGTTFSEISGAVAATIPIALSPLPEQHRIVAEIEKQFTRLDASVAALKRAQANLKRYRASVLKSACEGTLVPTEAELARAEGREYEPADVLLQRILAERRARWEAQEKKRGKYKEPVAPDASDLPALPEGWVWASLAQLSEIQGGIQKQPKRIPSQNAFPFLRGCLISWGPGQAAQHDPGHGSVDPSFRSFRQTLIILAQTPLQIQPAEGAFHHPTPGQYLESMLLPGPAHQLQIPATRFLGPLHQLAAVGPVGPNYLQPGILPQQTLQHQLGAVPVLYVGRMHRHCQQQPQGIDHYVALAPLHLLARIVTPWPPFSAVFTDWLSMIAALGLAWRPSD